MCKEEKILCEIGVHYLAYSGLARLGEVFFRSPFLGGSYCSVMMERGRIICDRRRSDRRRYAEIQGPEKTFTLLERVNDRIIFQGVIRRDLYTYPLT